MTKTIECNLCGKKYKRAGSLKRHINVCEIISKSKKSKELDREERYNAPSIQEIYIIVQKLVKENEEQKQEIKKLKDYVKRKQKKIDIIKILNEKHIGISLQEWLKSIEITGQELNILFDTNFETAMEIIIINKLHMKNGVIMAFNEKKNTLYVQKESWGELNMIDFKKIIINIQRGLILSFSKWSETLSEREKYNDNKCFLERQRKVLGGCNIEKTIQKLYKKIYAELSKNINEYKIMF
jgi:hypothetical protein